MGGGYRLVREGVKENSVYKREGDGKEGKEFGRRKC